MPKYGVMLNRTASLTFGNNLETAAAGPRRFKVYDLIVGSEAAPAENAFLYVVERTTVASTGGAVVTPAPKDPADVAASTVAREGTTGGQVLSGVVPLAIPLHQRATMRWYAVPGDEIVVAATASAGISIYTPTAGGLVAISQSIGFED